MVPKKILEQKCEFVESCIPNLQKAQEKQVLSLQRHDIASTKVIILWSQKTTHVKECIYQFYINKCNKC